MKLLACNWRHKQIHSFDEDRTDQIYTNQYFIQLNFFQMEQGQVQKGIFQINVNCGIDGYVI